MHGTPTSLSSPLNPMSWDYPESRSPARMAGTMQNSPESWSAAPMPTLTVICSGFWAPLCSMQEGHRTPPLQKLQEASATPAPTAPLLLQCEGQFAY